MKYWLMKSEPDVFGIDTLRSAPRGIASWDGVRNYQARNMMRDEMRRGDLAFFYHSSCSEPGIVGIMEIARDAYPDRTAFDPENPHYDPKSTPDTPRWVMVDVRFVEKFPHPVTLPQLRAEQSLRDMQILRKGNRLSITPVAKSHWNRILALAGK